MAVNNKKVGGLRWWVVGLVAVAAIINYIDRQAFGALWPDIAKDLFPDMAADDTKVIYGSIMTVFILSYAAGQTIFGKIFDWIGTRIGFALSIGVWSIATMLHAVAQGVLSFSIIRALLGVAEAGNWPGAAKANAEWFPTKERAFAQGIFNSGAAVGGIVAYPIIGLLSVVMGWQSIFIVVSLLGFIWLLPWFYFVKGDPKKHPWITEEEKQYILTGQKNQDADDANVEEYNPDTKKLLGHKESWGVIIASAALDPIWWLFIGWIPIYLNEVFGMNVRDIAFSAWVPYVGAMLGAWYGGLLARKKLGNGWSVDKTRKMVITLGCIIMIPCFVLLKFPGESSVLALFDVEESTTVTMANTQVKKITNDKAFKELFKNQEFVDRVAGKSVAEIKADPSFIEAYSKAEWPKPNEDATAEEKLLPKYGKPTDVGIAAIGSIEEIQRANNISALIAIIIMAILLFGFQTAIGNVQTIPSDIFGGKVVGTLSGFAGTAAKLAGAALTAIIPFITKGGNYIPAFIIGGALAAIALFAVWVLIPKVEKIKPA